MQLLTTWKVGFYFLTAGFYHHRIPSVLSDFILHAVISLNVQLLESVASLY